MKRLNYLILILAGMSMVTFSCDDDDGGGNPQMGNPTITVDPTSTAVAPGTAVNFTITAAAGSGATLASVTANDGANEETVSGNSYTYNVASDATIGSSITIAFTATDDQTPAKTATATVTISVGKSSVDVTDPNITDATLAGGSFVYNLDASVEYLMDGLVFLEEGAELNIPAGTVIKFKATPSNGNASALIITRGAKIFANGTATDPVILTAEADDMTGTTLTPEDNGQWGGLLILGNAPAEKKGATEIQIEGIDSSEPRGLYGGTVADDNSGSLTYVSIRYTGIGFQPGDELQGLTLGGVGSGTTIDYIDIFSSADDGIEIFGGTANIKHVSVAFSTDDDFDFDLGWRGTGQYLFSLMRSDAEGYDHAGEWDGASPDDATLFSMPELYNCTFIGPGTAATGRDKALLLRENFAGTFANSIIVDFPEFVMEVQDLSTGTQDSYSKIGTNLNIKNNTWSNFNGNTDLASMIKVTSKDGSDNPQTPDDQDGSDLVTHLGDNANTVAAASVINGISRTQDNGLDPRPATADTDVATTPTGLDAATYRGAFDPDATGTWLDGWSSLSKFGYLTN